jgi:hypothetical protein
MADIDAVKSTRKGAVVEGTNAKFSLAWKRYKSYLVSIGILENWYLDNFSKDKKHKFWAHSATQSEKADYILNKSGLINQNQLEPPWIMWQRPTSWLEELTQGSTRTGSLRSFYKGNFVDTDLPMSQNEDK